MEDALEIKKVIIPIAGMGTRFLPLSLVIPKEFFPVADKPLIEHIVEEAKNSGIKEVIFVTNPNQKMILQYFKKYPDLEKILAKRKKEKTLKELKDFEEKFSDISFSYVTQKQPLGDGHALLQAAKFVHAGPVAVSFSDDIIDSDVPALSQLTNIFKTCNAPVVALKTLPKNKIPAYGSVVVEKIANHLYKIKKIIEKPEAGEIESNLVIVGKYVLTPDVFGYLKKATPSQTGETVLSETLNTMLLDGKTIYGYEVKGEWLECGDKLKWMKSFMYMSLKDPEFGKEMKEYFKSLK